MRLRSWWSVVALGIGVVACLLIGPLFSLDSPVRDWIGGLMILLTFLAIGLGGWLANEGRKSE